MSLGKNIWILLLKTTWLISYRSIFSNIQACFLADKTPRSSLFYNTSARHGRHECDTNDTSATRVRHGRHECDTSATRVLHQQHESDTSATRTTPVQHEWEILILISTRGKTHFHIPILAIWQMKDYKERISQTVFSTWPKCQDKKFKHLENEKNF